MKRSLVSFRNLDAELFMTPSPPRRRRVSSPHSPPSLRRRRRDSSPLSPPCPRRRRRDSSPISPPCPWRRRRYSSPLSPPSRDPSAAADPLFRDPSAAADPPSRDPSAAADPPSRDPSAAADPPSRDPSAAADLPSRDPSAAVERCIPDQKTSSALYYLPEDIVLNDILPWVPFKPLCRFKLVCRSWSHLISRNPTFASAHSLRHHSPNSTSSSSALIFAAHRRLNLLPTLAGKPPDDVGLPDPLLSFKGDDRLSLYQIVASTNGLLCLHFYKVVRRHSFLYVCNPATGDGHFIPNIEDKNPIMGLAFDIAASPSLLHYQLVHLVRRRSLGIGIIQYGFEVFSSNTNQWIESGQKVIVNDALFLASKSVFVDGVIYWDCLSHLVWFDCRSTPGTGLAASAAGCLMNPRQISNFTEPDIGVWQGRLTWTAVLRECMEVWVLSGRGGSGRWERVHCVTLEAMVAPNQEFFSSFWPTVSLRIDQSMWEELFRQFYLLALPFEGGDRLFLKARRREERHVRRLKNHLLYQLFQFKIDLKGRGTVTTRGKFLQPY